MTEVAYELPDPAWEAHTWVWENEHAPAAQPPLGRDLFGAIWGPADPEGPPPRLSLHGYSYIRMDEAGERPMPPPPADDGQSPLQRWERRWLPRVDAVYAELQAFDPASVAAGRWAETLADQDQRWGRTFGGVHMETVIPADSTPWVDRFVSRFGEERRADALALLQGFPNATFERARALWELSRLARATPHVLEPSPDENDAARRAFAERFDAFLARWGDTMDGAALDGPTWRENPAAPLAMVAQDMARDDDGSPMRAEAERRRRREELEAELRAAAAGDAAAASLLADLPRAQEILPMRENHNYLCDQRLLSAMRRRWLAIGEHLVRQGTLPQADAVFYLHRPEAIDALEGRRTPSATALHQRRLFQDAVRRTPPPPVLGRARPRAGGAAVRELRGVAASAGVFRGRARLARSAEEAAQLTRDDVLVCVVTSVAWTPSFAVVGALVTDAGGALSHPAIVAREYGIPAVVGTREATATIPDGAWVVVDGDRGVVTVEAEPH